MLFILAILIFCLFVTFWIILFVCSENDISIKEIFISKKEIDYDRICKLESRVTDLEYLIRELESRVKELEKHIYIIPGDDGK